jgi:dynein heavy chain
LFIDPQLQAVKWVYNMERDHQVKVLKFKDNHFQSDMKACLSLGYPCLIEDTEENLEPLIDPILARQF